MSIYIYICLMNIRYISQLSSEPSALAARRRRGVVGFVVRSYAHTCACMQTCVWKYT